MLKCNYSNYLYKRNVTNLLKGDDIMIRNHFIFSDKLEIPTAYEDSEQQAQYEAEYRAGRARVDLGMDISLNYFHYLREECIRGYLDGVRDELLFQHAERSKEELS